jgi:hypothetical protein
MSDGKFIASPNNGHNASAVPGADGFFAIDARIWKSVCGWGQNESAAYLVLACGTARDNKRTSWSIQAVKKYAGLGWVRAKLTLERLIDDGFIRPSESHTEQHPRYELSTFPEYMRFQSLKYRDDKPKLRDLHVLSAIKEGRQPQTKAQRKRAIRLVEDDALWRDREGRYWLANDIHRLRSAEPSTAMELFVSLYSEHNLRDDGGISPITLAMNFERKKITRKGDYVIWGFQEAGLAFHWRGLSVADKWRIGTKNEWETRARQNLDLLQQLGLLSFVPHVYDRGRFDGEPIHVYGVGGIGEAEREREIGDAARSAARAMLSAEVRERAIAEGFKYLCPVHYSKNAAQLIGIGRLTYRPHTLRTARWFESLHRDGPDWIEKFNALEVQDGATPKRHQRVSKSVKSINEHQEYQRDSTGFKEHIAVRADAL